MLYKIRWWAYKHIDGIFYFRRCRKNYIVDMAAAATNPLILQIYGPFEAKTLAEAQKKLKEIITLGIRR